MTTAGVGRGRVLGPLLLATMAWACDGSRVVGPAPPASAPLAAATPVRLTVLYTSDEHGWIQPFVAEGARRGGATQLLAKLVRDEAHCAGAFPPAPLPDCRSSSTVLLSGGDNYTGPAISSFFRGETMAKTMRRLGYAASAFGNHEMDFGHEQFLRNRETAAFSYLAANLTTEDGAGTRFVRPYTIIERAGVRLGVIGIATQTTTTTAAAHRFVGLRFDDPVKTLDRWVPKLWAEGVDAVVLLAHECHDVVAPWIAARPDWDLSFVGTGHCHRTSVEVVGGVPVIGPDWRMQHYARVTLQLDPTQPQHERATLVGYELVELASATRDPELSLGDELDSLAASWAKQVEDALGEVIGHTATGLGKKSPTLGSWIVGAWKERFNVDVAVTTMGAVRQQLVPGPISLATIASIMPFDNELVLCTVPASALLPMLSDTEAIVAGLERSADGRWQLPGGGAIAPDTLLRVVTTDFLFYGGDGYSFHQHDAKPKATGVNWREPVIDWTRAAASTPSRPLEQLLRVAPRPKRAP